MGNAFFHKNQKQIKCPNVIGFEIGPCHTEGSAEIALARDVSGLIIARPTRVSGELRYYFQEQEENCKPYDGTFCSLRISSRRKIGFAVGLKSTNGYPVMLALGGVMEFNNKCNHIRPFVSASVHLF